MSRQRVAGPLHGLVGRASGLKRWYALYTKPNREHQVNALLQGQGIETYLPTVQCKARRRDRPDRVVFFPCYLFARVDFEVTPRSAIDWMPGVQRIVRSGDRPTVVADEIVESIRLRLMGIKEVHHQLFKQGDRVRITSGPLRDLEAIFDQSLSGNDRVRVLLDMLGRGTAVEIEYRQIAAL